MRRFWLLVVAHVFALQLVAQRLPLVNSGELLKRASVLQDSGKYELALKGLLQVPARDTNYVWVQARVAELYNYNQQYDQAIATSDRMLKRPDKFRSSLLASKALALEGKKEYDKAISLLQAALKDYPYDVQLRYQLAISYHNKLDYASATRAYYDVLEISPFSSNVHLNLGAISLWTGQKTHALMSYGMYLGVNNDDNSKLSLLENICSNQAQNDGAAKDKAGPNAFEKLDQIIRSKIAMDKKFKTEVPVDAAVVRQFEMMIKQLNGASTDVDDPWMKFYLPIYQALRDQKLMEPFLYHILSSSSIESVKKWNTKNEKSREKFFNVVNGLLNRERENVRAPESLGVGAKTPAFYHDDNSLSGVGGQLNGKEHGKWVYFHSNMEKAAEGTFDNGVKTGVWNYYSKNGAHSSTENEDTGEIVKWYPDGGKEYTYFLKDDEVEGDFVFFHPCGSVSERRTHKAGKREGKAQAFYATGAKSTDFEYVDGKLGGAWIDYDVFGNVKDKSLYKNGVRDGVAESFWANGKLKHHEPYMDGKKSGAAEGYFDNGKLWYKGSYENDEFVGEWLYYNRYGEQTERRFYGPDGKPDQDHIFYYNGKLYYKVTFAKGIAIQITYYDVSGKETWKEGSPDGNFDVKHFYANGQVYSEGKYKKGKRDGLWKQYYITGALQATYNYVDGEFEGEQKDYHKNGKDKIISDFKAGKHQGYYREFHITGNVAKEGWYVDGLAQQQWKLYNPDGSVSEDLYYLNDILVDTAYLYSVEGNVAAKNFHKGGETVHEMGMTPAQVVYELDVKDTKKYEIKYPNDQAMVKYNVDCGLLNGDFQRFYPDGKTYNKFSYTAGVLNGPLKAFDDLGAEHQSASYTAGAASGLWTYHNEANKLDQVIRYIDGEIDSVLTSYYETSQLYFTVEYRKGDRHGLMRTFAPSGAPLVEKLYDAGQIAAVRTVNKSGGFDEWIQMKPIMDIVAYYPNGTKAYEEKYENGLLSGEKRIWYPDGKMCREYNYKDGDYEGAFADYYPNGKICMKGQYHFDELEGPMEVFQESGMPLLTINYRFGRKSGTTTIFTRGVKSKEVVYYNGTPMK